MGIFLDIGCGAKKKKGYIGIDITNFTDIYPKGEFIQLDMDNFPLPFNDNSVSKVNSGESLEHFRNCDFVISEIVRVCKHNAEVEILVPHPSCESAFYIKHHTFFNSKSFTNEYELDWQFFKVLEVKALFWKKPFALFFYNYFFEVLFNIHPAVFAFYHKSCLRFLCPAWWLYFRLRIVKDGLDKKQSLDKFCKKRYEVLMAK